MSNLELVNVIQRSFITSAEDIAPLVEYLGMDLEVLHSKKMGSRAAAKAIAEYLRKMGSNDIATLLRGGEAVSYSEVVVDVGEKMGALGVSSDNSVEANEEVILWKVFEDTLDKMSDEEKRQLFRSMGIKEHDIPIGAATALIVQHLMRQYGGFAVYQTSLIVANMVSKALLGKGLTFAANAALTRTIGTLLGPIGWLATGIWLAIDLAGPAYRKTVPAVIHVAMLRQMLTKRITIGVVGDGSSGKDSLMHAVFGIDSDIDPVAGSTKEAMIYPLGLHGNAHIVNYPGFNDYRTDVNLHTDDYLHHTDVFIMVVDILRGISGNDTQTLKRLQAFDKPILICLNKVDLPRTPADKEKLRKAAAERLNGYTIIETAFDPDPRLSQHNIGCKDVYDWIAAQVKENGKVTDAIPPFQSQR